MGFLIPFEIPLGSDEAIMIRHTAKSHEGTLLDDGSGVVCSCGWVGRNTDPQRAHRQFFDHLVWAGRAAYRKGQEA